MLVLDSGALIALERNDRAMWRRFKAALLAETSPVSHGGVVGQVWPARGPRHALIARALSSINVRALDDVPPRGNLDSPVRWSGGSFTKADKSFTTSPQLGRAAFAIARLGWLMSLPLFRIPPALCHPKARRRI